jgi:mono/diheme cytochrome c family protein
MTRNVGAVAMLVVAGLLVRSPAARADDEPVARGKYLTRIAGCNDCHTPGHFTGGEDPKRTLAGSDVGLQGPDGTVVVGRNLTPDNETGLGRWTVPQIATAITSGVRPDGRVLSPMMPWPAFHNLSAADATAIALYLKSLPPVRHNVPGPFRANQQVPVPRFTILPPDPASQVSR